MNKTLEILPCPFCKEEEDLSVQIGTRDREGLPVAITCGTCGAVGPYEYYKDSPEKSLADEGRMFLYALIGWNKR
jgi:uncharacterized protein YbaR (Trm112 family)